VLGLIERSGIQLPDQEDTIRAHAQNVGEMILDDLVTPELVKRIADTKRILLFEGKGWQDQTVSLESST
jgi:hypothetical protein